MVLKKLPDHFKVLQPEVVRDVLSLMHSCGMYNYSGQFAFKVILMMMIMRMMRIVMMIMMMLMIMNIFRSAYLQKAGFLAPWCWLFPELWG